MRNKVAKYTTQRKDIAQSSKYPRSIWWKYPVYNITRVQERDTKENTRTEVKDKNEQSK
jgi:hypothetical protein